jgi:hypothetical protein
MNFMLLSIFILIFILFANSTWVGTTTRAIIIITDMYIFEGHWSGTISPVM